MHSFETFDEDPELSMPIQGVYLVTVMQNGALDGLYVGCAYSEDGLGKRIRNHKSHAYRTNKRQANKALYQRMNAPGATWYFNCLASFSHNVAREFVLLVEGTLTCVMGAYQSQRYQKVRADFEALPTVKADHALNRSDPLVEEYTMARDHAADWERQRDEALQGKESNLVWHHGQRHASLSFLRQVLGLTVPTKTVRDWNLGEFSKVFLKFDLANDRHPNGWVEACSEADGGRRLGISVATVGEEETRQIWLKSNVDPEKIIPKANGMVEWLSGRIEDPYSHQWDPNSAPVIGSTKIVQADQLSRRQEKANKKLEYAATGHNDPEPSEGMSELQLLITANCNQVTLRCPKCSAEWQDSSPVYNEGRLVIQFKNCRECNIRVAAKPDNPIIRTVLEASIKRNARVKSGPYVAKEFPDTTQWLINNGFAVRPTPENDLPTTMEIQCGHCKEDGPKYTDEHPLYAVDSHKFLGFHFHEKHNTPKGVNCKRDKSVPVDPAQAVLNGRAYVQGKRKMLGATVKRKADDGGDCDGDGDGDDDDGICRSKKARKS